jgi:hypothetical protein
MRVDQIRGLMEAYSQVHETSEVVNDEIIQEVEEINEAPMTAFQAAGGQAKLDQINRNRSPRSGRATAASIEKLGQDNLFKAGGGQAAIDKGPTKSQNTRGGGSIQVPTRTRQDVINRGTVAAAKPAAAKPAATPAAPKPAATAAAPKPAATAAAPKPAATAAAPKPAATSTAKPAATAAAKPAAPKPATGMLGKTSFERRTPTSSELKAAQSARAAGASPEKALQAAKSAGSTLSQTVAAASKPTAFNPSSSSSSTAAAKPTAPKPTPRQQRLNMDIDLFDLVKGYLLDEGYAETEEGAIVMMVNMSEGWRESILESCGVQLDELSEEVEQLDEISLKTKMKAYSASRDVDADYNYGSKVHDQGDRIKKAIVKKHGEKAGEHAERAAEVQNFGRGTPRAKSRIEKNRTYRTTKAGKMHGQDQAKLKSDLKYNRSSRNEELELWVEELIAEGYDLSNYTWEEVAEIYAQELELAEAQSARENPEDHDKEEKKKYEKVRGERTPMPPRGDKRREDFEKWYAANVR